MQAAQRSQALHKKHCECPAATAERSRPWICLRCPEVPCSDALRVWCAVELDRATQRSAIDIIHDAILEFKSHCKFAFPEASGGSVAGLRAGGSAGAKGQAAPESDATSSISSTPRAPPDAVSVGVPPKREAAAAPAGAEAQARVKRTVTADKGPASSIMQAPPPPNAHGSPTGLCVAVCSACAIAWCLREASACRQHDRIVGCWRRADSASCLQGSERACLGARASTLPTLLAISGISCRCLCVHGTSADRPTALIPLRADGLAFGV